MARSQDKPQVNQDLKFQTKVWRAEVIGWIFFSVILLAALLGFTGTGPLNNIETSNQDISVKYGRFARYLAPASVEVEAKGKGNSVRFWVNEDFLSLYKIERITPEPDKVTDTGSRIEYLYEDTEEVNVTFSLQPEVFGYYTPAVGQDGNSIVMNQFVYP